MKKTIRDYDLKDKKVIIRVTLKESLTNQEYEEMPEDLILNLNGLFLILTRRF